MPENPSPQQIAHEVISAPFVNEPHVLALVDQIDAALDQADVLIDPVDNGIWQNLKAGHLTCQYVDGDLRFRITEAGERHLAAVVGDIAEGGDQ